MGRPSNPKLPVDSRLLVVGAKLMRENKIAKQVEAGIIPEEFAAEREVFGHLLNFAFGNSLGAGQAVKVSGGTVKSNTERIVDREIFGYKSKQQQCVDASLGADCGGLTESLFK